MPSYRIGTQLGRPFGTSTPHALVCEQCRQELPDPVPVERGQEAFAGMTAAGVIHVWPTLAKSVNAHEARCKPKRPSTPG